MIKQINIITGEETTRAYTAEEQAFLDEERAEYLANKPMNDWLRGMAQTDDLPRALEDHIRDDHGGVASNAQLQAKYDAKVALRNKKPS